MANDYRTYGAALMFLTGLLYLLFEDQILGSSHHSAAVSRTGSRMIMGMQVRHLPPQ
jgi:phosphatidylinositol glycan class N